MKRVFLTVLDSFGIGQMPDAEFYGDRDCNTLKRISKSKNFSAENLINLGLGNIDGVDYLNNNLNHTAAIARLAEKSVGKDTTTGHFEIAGIVLNKPFPTYPNGFPKEIIKEFENRAGVGTLCNKPYSGTEVIKDYGAEHLKSGKLIVYTSADSVFQIAAHEEIVPPEKLYEYCKTARNILRGEHAVGRVIARPFSGKEGKFYRTANRRDFSFEPPGNTVLDAIKESGKTVCAIGKINDIFAGRGITEKYISHSNKEGMELTLNVLKNKDFNGLCFTNLVDFDMLYGHRQNIDGYAEALAQFDNFLPEFLKNMNNEDVLIITADHGCDPGDQHTDHTREYVPLIIYGKKISAENLGTLNGFGTIAKFISEYLRVPFNCNEPSIFKAVVK